MSSKKSQYVAFISDIHANYEALKAVEEDALEAGAERFIFCGDAVGHGPNPNEVLNWLQENKVSSILGNVDFNVLRILKRQSRYNEPERYHKFLSYGWTWNEMTKENRYFLAQMKKSLRFNLWGCATLLVHGLPNNLDGILSEEVAETDGKRMLKKLGVEIFAAGHTHKPFALQTTRGWLINCGSVGMPRGKAGRATYVLGQFDTDLEPGFEVRKVRYDGGAVAKSFSKQGLPSALAMPFSTGGPIPMKQREALKKFLDDPRFVAMKDV